jgi:hypothetical protein
MFTPAGQVPKDDESKVFTESLDRLIGDFERRGKTVVLIGPISPPGFESASVVARQMAFRHKVDEPLFLPESAFIAKQGDLIAHYASRDDLFFIRPDRIQCQQGRCDYFRDGASLFADDTHLAQAALPLFRPAFEPALQRALIQTTQPKP